VIRVLFTENISIEPVRNMGRKDKFKKVNNYAVYYGNDSFDELSQFDLAIIEPGMYSDEDIDFLVKKNTLVIAYVSVLEINKSSEILNLLKEEDYLFNGREKVMNVAFDNYIMDLRSKRWQSLLMNNIGKLLTDKSFDGIFLDTIADIEYFNLDMNLRILLIEEYVKFLKELKKYFPDHIIIQNNGILQIIYKSADLVDGLMLENMDISKKNTGLVEDISNLLQKHDLRIFILYEDRNNLKKNIFRDTLKLSKANNFLIYRASHEYVGKVNPPINP